MQWCNDAYAVILVLGKKHNIHQAVKPRFELAFLLDPHPGTSVSQPRNTQPQWNWVVSLCGRLVGCNDAYATILVGKHNRHQTVTPRQVWGCFLDSLGLLPVSQPRNTQPQWNWVVSLCGRFVGCNDAYATILEGKHNRHQTTVTPRFEVALFLLRPWKFCPLALAPASHLFQLLVWNSTIGKIQELKQMWAK